MLSGPPLPLPDEFPLSRLTRLAPASELVGAWVRGNGRHLPLLLRSCNRQAQILLSGDLGSLLRRCSLVAVRVGTQPQLLRAEELIRCRALRIVTGVPYLPSADQLKSLFPDVQLEPTGFSIPIGDRPPEEVLGLCLTRGIPVLESRISYRS
jgi:hypothetical protein